MYTGYLCTTFQLISNSFNMHMGTHDAFVNMNCLGAY